MRDIKIYIGGKMIYCTKGTGVTFNVPISNIKLFEHFIETGSKKSLNCPVGNGKVIDEFICDQMIAGIYDIFNHICEQYFSGDDDNTSDYISEGLMRSLLVSSRKAVKNPNDYEARSNIMWTATWALNTLVAKGKSTDWMVHMLGQAVGAYTGATHGMTLAAVSLPYYRYISQYGLKKFARFAQNVWGINPQGRSDEQLAMEDLDKMEAWMREIGLVMNIGDLGATEDMIEGIADATLILDGGYKVFTRDEVVDILKKSM